MTSLPLTYKHTESCAELICQFFNELKKKQPILIEDGRIRIQNRLSSKAKEQIKDDELFKLFIFEHADYFQISNNEVSLTPTKYTGPSQKLLDLAISHLRNVLQRTQSILLSDLHSHFDRATMPDLQKYLRGNTTTVVNQKLKCLVVKHYNNFYICNNCIRLCPWKTSESIRASKSIEYLNILYSAVGTVVYRSFDFGVIETLIGNQTEEVYFNFGVTYNPHEIRHSDRVVFDAVLVPKDVRYQWKATEVRLLKQDDTNVNIHRRYEKGSSCTPNVAEKSIQTIQDSENKDSNTLDQVEKRLAMQETKLATIGELFSDQNKIVEKNMTDNKSAMNTLQEDLKFQMSGLITKLEKHYAGSTQELKESLKSTEQHLENSVTEQKLNLEKVEQKYSNELMQQKNYVSVLKQEISKFKAEHEKLTEKVGNKSKSIDNVERKMTIYEKNCVLSANKLTKVEGQNDALDAKVKKLETQNEDLKTEVVELKTKNESLESRVKVLETTLEEVMSRLPPPVKGDLIITDHIMCDIQNYISGGMESIVVPKGKPGQFEVLLKQENCNFTNIYLVLQAEIHQIEEMKSLILLAKGKATVSVSVSSVLPKVCQSDNSTTVNQMLQSFCKSVDLKFVNNDMNFKNLDGSVKEEYYDEDGGTLNMAGIKRLIKNLGLQNKQNM